MGSDIPVWLVGLLAVLGTMIGVFARNKSRNKKPAPLNTEPVTIEKAVDSVADVARSEVKAKAAVEHAEVAEATTSKTPGKLAELANERRRRRRQQ